LEYVAAHRQQVHLFINETPDAAGQLPTAQSVEQSDLAQGPPMVFGRSYEETYRPQFHFTPQINWMNDVNGPVYYAGEYHLFYQYAPWGLNGLAANKSWGHAVSRDLFHWKQLATALLPDQLGTIYSGSAVVDEHNTAGFQSGSKKPLVAFYTNAGTLAPRPRPFTQSLAYSNDRGRT
jgi:sucrose-6-phosphate hydrolase SacC (GH32 family)